MNKNDQDSRKGSTSPKAYWGCLTCKLKNIEMKKVKSRNKLNVGLNVQYKNKTGKTNVGGMKERELDVPKSKIKLTDLCDEDKRRIVELIEELTKFAAKNYQFKESINQLQKIKQEQQEYIMKQANIHLEEKNHYVSEINEFKSKIEETEKELQNKISNWENQEKFMDVEMSRLVKLLEKSAKERNEMHREIKYLRNCLKNSLESFQKLRAEVKDLQSLEQTFKECRTVSCQTEAPMEGADEEEFLSTQSPETAVTKSSLDIINEKLEHVYKLLKKRSHDRKKNMSKKYDIDLSILLKNDALKKESESDLINRPPEGQIETIKEDSEDGMEEYKFLKPFDQYSKTSLQAERILKRIGKPVNLIVNECAPKQENNKLIDLKPNETSEDFESFTKKLLQKTVVQKNNLFKSSEDHRYEEDRILDELFYSHKSLNFGCKSFFKFEKKERRKKLPDQLLS